MVVRELPHEEWYRLQDLPMAGAGLPAPEVLVVVAEDDHGDIIGVWTAGPIIVLEGLWVREDHQKKSALYRMFHFMVEQLKAIGVPVVYSIVQTPDMHRLAAHGGFQPIDGQLIALNLGDK